MTPFEFSIRPLYCDCYLDFQTQSKALQTIELLIQHNVSPILYKRRNYKLQQHTILHHLLEKRRKKGYFLNHDENRIEDCLESIINWCIDNDYVTK